MLTSIDFDDKQLFAADEVADVAADRLLSDKFISIDLPVTNAIPELRFGVSLVGAQLTRPEGPFAPRIASPLTRRPRCARSPTSPRKDRGELKKPSLLATTYAAAVGKL
jgi:hypothetical protein